MPPLPLPGCDIMLRPMPHPSGHVFVAQRNIEVTLSSLPSITPLLPPRREDASFNSSVTFALSHEWLALYSCTHPQANNDSASFHAKSMTCCVCNAFHSRAHILGRCKRYNRHCNFMGFLKNLSDPGGAFLSFLNDNPNTFTFNHALCNPVECTHHSYFSPLFPHHPS